MYGEETVGYRNLSPVVGFTSVQNTALCKTKALREIRCSDNRDCCQVASDRGVSLLYEVHLESKERFAIKKYLLITGKKKEYAGFITHLHILLHIVTLDTEPLVVP